MDFDLTTKGGGGWVEFNTLAFRKGGPVSVMSLDFSGLMRGAGLARDNFRRRETSGSRFGWNANAVFGANGTKPA